MLESARAVGSEVTVAPPLSDQRASKTAKQRHWPVKKTIGAFPAACILAFLVLAMVFVIVFCPL